MPRVQVLLVPLLVLASGNAWSDAASDTLQVSARVLPHARLDSQDTATTLRITAADLERGYVEVTQHYSLRTNAPDRVALQVHTRLDYARSIEVAGFGAVLRLLDDPIELVPPARDALELTFRVWLSPQLGAGEYAAPLVRCRRRALTQYVSVSTSESAYAPGSTSCVTEARP